MKQRFNPRGTKQSEKKENFLTKNLSIKNVIPVDVIDLGIISCQATEKFCSINECIFLVDYRMENF